MSSAIVVSGLRKSYGRTEALRGVSFDVAEGEVFGLLGPNGAGKTTTVEILEGYRARDGGDATVLGFDPGAARKELRERIGVVLQQSDLSPLLTVRETHRMFAGYFADSRDVDEVIELVGLGEKRDARVKTLSGGRSGGSTSALRSSAIPISSSSTSRPPASTLPHVALPGT